MSTPAPISLSKGTRAQLGQAAVDAWSLGIDPTPTGRMLLHAYGIPTKKPVNTDRAVKLLVGAGINYYEVVEATGVPESEWPHVNPYTVDVLDQHVAGKTVIEIAKTVPMSRSWVTMVLRDRHLEPNVKKRRDLSTRQRAHIRKLKEAGQSMAAIARQLGVSIDQVRYTIEGRR